jgi:hypothetical protein
MTLFDASNPSNFNVRPPSANVTSDLGPASQSRLGGNGAAGGAATEVARPGALNTFTGSNGVTREVQPAATPAAGSVGAQSFGGLPLPQNTGIGTAAAPTVAPTFSVPRPTQASIGQMGAYGVQNADAGTGKIASTLEDAAFRAGLRASRGSRSAADAQAQILGTLAQLGGQRLGVAAGLASGDRDAAAGLDRAALSETGANQRAALADTGLTTRTSMEQAGANQRTTLGTLAELRKPQQIVGKDGTLLSVSGDKATTVTDAEGKTVNVGSRVADDSKKALQDAYAKLAESAAAFLPPAGVPTEADIGTARMRAAQLAGYDLKKDKKGALFVQINGEWMPL